MSEQANDGTRTGHRIAPMGAGDGLSILVLTDSYLPHAGGSRMYYHTLYKSLAEHFSARITILTKKVRGWREFDAGPEARQLRIVRRLRPLDNWKWYQTPKLLPTFADALLLAQRESFDMIHAGDLFPQGVMGMWLRKITGIPYIVYCHGEEITQTDLRRYQPRVRNLIYDSADAVIAANEFARSNLRRLGIPDKKIVKITPGVDSARFAPHQPDPDLVRRLGLDGKITLLTVGRLVPRKGHIAVLKALARIRDQVPPFHYLIAGEGPECTTITSGAREFGIAGNVTLLGKVPDHSLTDFYNLCDVFVLCNREVAGDIEGFGMVFLEASATGKPVLGCRSGGACEAVVDGTTGLLVDPQDEVGIAHALRELLTDAVLRQRLGHAGRNRALRHFSWDSRAIQLRDICSELAGRSAVMMKQRTRMPLSY